MFFESRISAGAVEKLPKARAQGNLRQTLSLHGPMTWKVKRRNAWKDIANLRRKQQSATPGLDDHHFKEDENGSVGEFSAVCSHVVLKCLYFGSYW